MVRSITALRTIGKGHADVAAWERFTADLYEVVALITQVGRNRLGEECHF
ncbi:MAG TPA: hypothetical protein VM686_29455 [Polyangiaceae bacterium]|nr:hypothetical protein [Polyangiaceae bacterium]